MDVGEQHQQPADEDHAETHHHPAVHVVPAEWRRIGGVAGERQVNGGAVGGDRHAAAQQDPGEVRERHRVAYRLVVVVEPGPALDQGCDHCYFHTSIMP